VAVWVQERGLDQEKLGKEEIKGNCRRLEKVLKDLSFTWGEAKCIEN
jgi:hypothetical protein